MPITAALQVLESTETDYLPSALLNNISNFGSLFTLILTCDVANELKAVSKCLQRENCDLLAAYDEIKTATNSLSQRIYKRTSFFELYSESKRKCTQPMNDFIQKYIIMCLFRIGRPAWYH